MLGLPKTTELNQQLPKNAIYSKFHMNTNAKEQIDKDISRIYIVNEVSASKVNIKEGKNIKSFFVMLVLLKHQNFNEKNIMTLTKLIPQNMVMVLEFEDKIKLAVYHMRLLQTEWILKDSRVLMLKGLDLDSVWENIIVQIGGFTIENDRTLDEQIKVEEQKHKIQKEIMKLEKKARTEKQPKRKFEIHTKIQEYRKQLEGINNGKVKNEN